MGRKRLRNSYSLFDGKCWKSTEKIKDFKNAFMLEMTFMMRLSNQDKILIQAIQSMKNLNSIKIVMDVNLQGASVSTILHHLSTGVGQNIPLIKIEFELSKVDSIEILNRLFSLLQSQNISCFNLSISDISFKLFNNLAHGIEKLVHLTNLNLKITKEIGITKGNLFQSLNHLQSLRTLKINIRSNKSAINPPSSSSFKKYLVLPECEQLKLNLQDFQYFFSFKEFSNLHSLYVILNDSISVKDLSRILQTQIPNLLAVETLKIKFPFYTAELIDFSCKAIELCFRLKSLNIFLDSVKKVDCSSILSTIRNHKTIQNLSIKVKGDTFINFSEINVTDFKNIRNLEINSYSFLQEYHKSNKQFIKALKNLDFLYALKTRKFSYYIPEILKSKRLVTIIY